jgi:hypothetical protein
LKSFFLHVAGCLAVVIAYIMKTLLIPVDLTPESENALKFAAEWVVHYHYERIILFMSFYTSMYESVIMAGEFANVDQHYLNRIREDAREQLNNWCARITEKTGNTIQVHTAITELPLLRGVLEMVNAEHPVMILAGSSIMNVNNDTTVSGKIISLAKVSPVRVMIIPSHYTYQPVRKALVPFDLNAIDRLKKLEQISITKQWEHVELMVLYVDRKQRNHIPDTKLDEAEKNLHGYLSSFQHNVYYVHDNDVINGILNFEKLKEVQMMIALPGQYSFLASMTHNSITEALYLNSQIPIMILK